MEYTNFILLILGFFGIFIHNLIKIDGINRQTNGNFAFKTFFKIEWTSLLISVCVVVVCLIAKNEIKQLNGVSNWLGLSFVAIGYMAQSIVYSFMGKAQKIIDDKSK